MFANYLLIANVNSLITRTRLHNLQDESMSGRRVWDSGQHDVQITTIHGAERGMGWVPAPVTCPTIRPGTSPSLHSLARHYACGDGSPPIRAQDGGLLTNERASQQVDQSVCCPEARKQEASLLG